MGYEEIRKLGQKGGSHLHALDTADLTNLTRLVRQKLMQPMKSVIRYSSQVILRANYRIIPQNRWILTESYLSYSFIPYRVMNR